MKEKKMEMIKAAKALKEQYLAFVKDPMNGVGVDFFATEMARLMKKQVDELWKEIKAMG